MFVASFVLGGPCWVTAKQMLTTFDELEKTNLLTAFSSHVAKMYSPMVAGWVKSNWKLVEGQHIQLIELLKFQVLP